MRNFTRDSTTTTEHLTTAADVAIMSRELLRHELITNYTTIWMDSLRDGKTELVNTNKLVRFYQGTQNGHGAEKAAVVMGSGNSSDRGKAMLNWGFADYSTVTPKIDPSLIPDVGVINGVTERITPRIPDADPILIEKGREANSAEGRPRPRRCRPGGAGAGARHRHIHPRRRGAGQILAHSPRFRARADLRHHIPPHSGFALRSGSIALGQQSILGFAMLGANFVRPQVDARLCNYQTVACLLGSLLRELSVGLREFC